MGKTTGFLSQVSGKLDDNFQTRQTSHGTFLARNPRKTSKPRRSEKQANTRCQLPNATANYRLYNGKLSEAYEGKSAGVSDFNSFVQVNYGKCAVYITKQVSASGGCVLGEYQFSRGSLPAISIGLNQSGILVSGIALDSLVIDANTTVADFSMAVLQNNGDGWEEGDQVTHFYGVQWEDSEGVPRATMQAQKVILDLSDQSKLWEVATNRGFSSVDGYLGMNAALQNSGAAWVHSRNKSDGSTQVSTQRLTVVSDMLEDYKGYDAMLASAQSYGGINTKSVYLNPASSLSELGRGSQSGSNGSNSSSGSSGNGGSNTGGNGGGTGGGDNTGGNTGGNTGSVTPSTPKLTISRTGTGTSTVTANGTGVNSGAEVAAGTEVTVSVTPAEGATPTASLNGSSVTLTESEGVYTGSFSMPSSNATLVINSGGASGGGSGDMN